MVPYLPLCSFDELAKHVPTSFQLQNCVLLRQDVFSKTATRGVVGQRFLHFIFWKCTEWHPGRLSLAYFWSDFWNCSDPQNGFSLVGYLVPSIIFFWQQSNLRTGLWGCRRWDEMRQDARGRNFDQNDQKLETCQIPRAVTRHRVTTQPRGVFPIFLNLFWPAGWLLVLCRFLYFVIWLTCGAAGRNFGRKLEKQKN